MGQIKPFVVVLFLATVVIASIGLLIALLLPAVQPVADPLHTTARAGAMAARVVPDLRDVALRTAPHVAAQRRRPAGHYGMGGFPDPTGHLVRLGIRRNLRCHPEDSIPF